MPRAWRFLLTLEKSNSLKASKALTEIDQPRWIAHFVSDVHLDSLDEPRGLKFLEYLKSLKTSRPISHLFLVGDIFDLWVAEHQFFVKKYSMVVEQIRRLISEGVKIHYFEGNHDLYLSRFWQDDVGVTVHEGPEYFDLGETRVRVEHGDQIDPEDKGYLFLRWFLRTNGMKFVAKNLPDRVAVYVGKKASRHSREYTSTTKRVSANTMREKLHIHAHNSFAERPFDLLVSGHVHLRDEYCFEKDGKTVCSVNLGTWLDAPVIYVLSDKSRQWVDI